MASSYTPDAPRRSGPRRRRAFVLWACGVLLVVATVAFALGKDSWKRTVTEPGADALYYYAYLPSLVLDHDLDLSNQYRVTRNWYHLRTTPTGRPGNVFGIGPALFELPVFVVGHGVAIVTGSRRDGFSRWETVPCMWCSILFTLGALLLAYRLCRRRLGPGMHAFVGPLLALVSGPVLYYAIRQPGYSHPCATFFATWLIERWDASFEDARPRSVKTWLVLGAAAGAAMLARPQLIVWVPVLAVAVVDDIRARSGVPLWRLASRWAAGAAVAASIVLPQLIAWKVLYGSWTTVPQGPGFMRWDQLAWSEVLFSSRNGLFPWAPLYAPMLLSLLLVARRLPRLVLALIVGLVGQVIANGAAWDWWAGGAFGGRRFDSTYVVFAVGAAAGVRWLLGRLPSRGSSPPMPWWRWLRTTMIAASLAATALVAAATVQRAVQTSVVSAWIRGGRPASATWRAVGGLRGRLAAWLSDASRFPASACFALRHDVSLAAYDRLVGVHVLGETYPGLNRYPDKVRDIIAVGRKDPHILGAIPIDRGHARLPTGRARILVGLNRRGGVKLTFEVDAAASIQLRTAWNGRTLEQSSLGVGTSTVEVETQDLIRGINTLEIVASGPISIGSIEVVATPAA